MGRDYVDFISSFLRGLFITVETVRSRFASKSPSAQSALRYYPGVRITFANIWISELRRFDIRELIVFFYTTPPQTCRYYFK